jgi:hypothetical protein
LWEDNKAAIIVAEGETSSVGRSKHIDVRFKHVTQTLIREGVARFRYVSTNWNYGDLITKPNWLVKCEDNQGVMTTDTSRGSYVDL